MSYNKYSNKKTYVDNIKFDSKREAQRYSELKLLEKAGEISCLKLQPKYTLQPTFTKRGKSYRSITYVADFEYYDLASNDVIVEDVKGYETADFKIKKKMFEYKYPELELKLIK